MKNTKKENKNYFISYYCQSILGQPGFGNLTFSTQEKISSNFLKMLAKEIEKDNNVKGVIILDICNLDSL